MLPVEKRMSIPIVEENTVPESGKIFFIARDTGTYTESANSLCGRLSQIRLHLCATGQSPSRLWVLNATTVAGKRMPLPIYRRKRDPEHDEIFFIAWGIAHTQQPKIAYAEGSCKSACAFTLQPIDQASRGFQMPRCVSEKDGRASLTPPA